MRFSNHKHFFACICEAEFTIRFAAFFERTVIVGCFVELITRISIGRCRRCCCRSCCCWFGCRSSSCRLGCRRFCCGSLRIQCSKSETKGGDRDKLFHFEKEFNFSVLVCQQEPRLAEQVL